MENAYGYGGAAGRTSYVSKRQSGKPTSEEVLSPEESPSHSCSEVRPALRHPYGWKLSIRLFKNEKLRKDSMKNGRRITDAFKHRHELKEEK